MSKWHAHHSRIVTEEGRIVAIVMGKEFTIEEHRNHTRLLTVVPELLKACEMVRDTAELLEQRVNVSVMISYGAFKKVTDAIAKAKGQNESTTAPLTKRFGPKPE